MNRSRRLATGIFDQYFDLVVIGAGVNGTGIARDAAMRGFKVLLLDKGDIASGTSSRSGRMIHGGLRYLAHGDIGLVWESLQERATLIRIAPHLVQKQPLVIPFYANNSHRPWQVRLGMTVLDLFAVLSRSWLGAHERLSREGIRARMPGLTADSLTGAAVMSDAYAVHGERLCVENCLSAAHHKAVLVTHAEVQELCVDAGKVQGLVFRDTLSDASHRVSARMVINAAGPWVDRVLGTAPEQPRLVGGTKGSFLVVDHFPGAPEESCFYEAISDQRQAVVLPWNGHCLLGTTDRRYEGDPTDVTASDEEIDYLLSETNRIFPQAQLTRADIRFSYAGVRPLPYRAEGAEGKITRRHIIHDHGPSVRGLISVIGGKFSTFRSLAEEVVDKAVRELANSANPCRTHNTPLPGADGDLDSTRERLTARSALSQRSIDHLLQVYGTRSEDVVALGRDDPTLLQPFDEQTQAIGAELLFAFRAEFAETLDDALIRRSMVGYDSAFDPQTACNALAILQSHLGWDGARCDAELQRYIDYIARFQPRSLNEHQQLTRRNEHVDIKNHSQRDDLSGPRPGHGMCNPLQQT
jgi:glycerol-3-phosphate dehydrogenase